MITILEQIILHCSSKLGRERTFSAIYHLLNGKKSAQTIQDAHLFHVDSFFDTAPTLTRELFESVIRSLENKQLIRLTNNQQVICLEKGNLLANELYKNYPFLPFLDGWSYQNSSQFWERLSLLVQVCSNLANQQSNYVPIQKNKETQNWIKSIFSTSKGDSRAFPEKLLMELEVLLESQDVIDPAVLVIRLTGFHTVGLTEKQAIDFLQLEDSNYRFQFQTLLHIMLRKIEEEPNNFPLLKKLYIRNELDMHLTSSAQRTYHLLKKGLGLKEISRIRKLKENTIQDHIVEIALSVKDFSIDEYVDHSLQLQIKEAIQKASSRQLRNIRQFINVDYFQIRLVIAKFGDML